MRIAVDGPQGSGKTTICKALSDHLNLEYCKHDARHNMTIQDALRQNVVHDRSLVSSMVYGYLWNCGTVPLHTNVLTTQESLDRLVILWSSDPDLLIERVSARPSHEHQPLSELEKSVLLESNILFKAMADILGIEAIDIATTPVTIDSIIK